MLITGEQFNILCATCPFLWALAKNAESFIKPGKWPSWDAEEVFVDCFEYVCPTGLLAKDNPEDDDFTWRLMTGHSQHFDEWWQEIVTAYDKLVRNVKINAPPRPSHSV